MTIIYLVIGFALGFLAKLGADHYRQFKNEEQKLSDELQELLIGLKAIDLNKNL